MSTKFEIKIKDKKIPYTLSRRKVKNTRLEFKTGNLVLITPLWVKDAEKILEEHKNWIYEKYMRIQNAISKSESVKINRKRSREGLKKIVNDRVEKYSRELKVKVNKIFIRKMKTRWGSLSGKNNMTLNSLLRYLPEEFIEYIVFHETAHLRVRGHKKEFWKIIEDKYRNYKRYEDRLFNYWFILKNKSL